MKQLKWRLIAGAMIAFLILLVLIFGCTVMLGHIQMEKESDQFLRRMLNGELSYSPRTEPPIFGYRPEKRSAPAGYFDIQVTKDGEILQQKAFGILDQDSVDTKEAVRQILESRNETGKLGIYKYGKADRGEYIRIIVVDQSIQIRALYSILRGAGPVGLVCLLLMFIILQPIAHHIARAGTASQERERQFITNAGHELKTPVAVIQSNIEAMEMVQGGNKWSRNIHQQLERLNHLIGQQLLMERLSEQRLRKKPEAVDLGRLTVSVSREMREMMEKRELTVSAECSSGCMIKGYAEAVEQLLRILLDNAARYASRGSEIKLKLEQARKEWILTCENRVEKLPECAPEQLLERFHRGGIVRQPGDPGCGIGLSAAADITDMHRGHITVSYPDEHSFRIAVQFPSCTPGKGKTEG